MKLKKNKIGLIENKSEKSKIEFEHSEDAFSLGPTYLEYCVKKGWLERSGEEPNMQYTITETGKKNLDQVQFNFDLSAIKAKGKGSKKKNRRHQK